MTVSTRILARRYAATTAAAGWVSLTGVVAMGVNELASRHQAPNVEDAER